MEKDRGNGIEISLGDLVFAVSAALDLVSPVVANHHLRVSRIARAIARRLGLPASAQRDLLLAAAMHDAGAFSLHERLEIMRFEDLAPEEHADAGYRLLRSFPHFEQAAQIVRYHHLLWDYGRGEQRHGRPVPAASHVLHLADRVSILPIDWSGARGISAAHLRIIAAGSGSRFSPALVEAFADVAAQRSFLQEVSAPGDGDLRGDPALGAATLSEPDVRNLGRLFWQLVDYRSRFTATHTSGVSAVAGFLAPLAGITGAAGRCVAIAAGLHDIGKLAVPRETLEKERPLTRAERGALRDHPLHGWRVLGHVPGLEQINTWANFHHERLDGSGYPFGVPSALIPLESRIVAVADVFTALTEERPYRRGMSGREAVGILQGMADGGVLDHDVVAAVAEHREQASSVRRLAQDGASDHYSAFLEHIPSGRFQHSAA